MSHDDNSNDKSGAEVKQVSALDLLDLLDKILMFLVAIVMFGMMAVTFVDVVGRYVFSAPAPGGFELIQFMMPLAMFGALPVITRSESHITISVMSNMLGPRHVWFQRLVILIGCIVVNVGITYIMWLQGVELAEAQQISGFLEWSFAPPAYLISLLSAVTVVIIILMLMVHIFWPSHTSKPASPDVI